MDHIIRQMTIDDYVEVYRVWEQTEGLTLEEADTKEAMEIYLNRNKGLCFVACVGDQIVGPIAALRISFTEENSLLDRDSGNWYASIHEHRHAVSAFTAQ